MATKKKAAKKAVADPKANETLAEILRAYEALTTAERDHKDAKKEGLDEAKTSCEEFREAIGEARSCEASEAGSKLSTVLVCWDAYLEAKAAAAEVTKAKKEEADEADKRLKELIGNARQGKLDF